jgi:hypothetical protein
MTHHDASAYPEEPERIGDLFGEVSTSLTR